MPAIFSSLLFLALAALAAPSQGGIVFSQSPSPNGNSYVSDFQAATGLKQQADDFSLAASALIKGIYAWGEYVGGLPTDSFTIRFFADNGSGSPAITPIFQSGPVTPVYRVATGLNTGAPVTYEYGFDLSTPFNAAAATPYYLSIVNDTSAATAWAWFSQNGSTAGDFWSRGSDGSSWNRRDGNLAFALSTDSVVPELDAASGTGALALLAGALALAGERRRRNPA